MTQTALSDVSLDQDDLSLKGRTVAHLCIDMQKMFAEDTDWRTPWMERGLPQVCALAEAPPAATIFTRFLPPRSPQDASGGWRAYYRRWHNFTRNEIDPAMIELVALLAALIPPGLVFDKLGFSPFMGTDLHQVLKERGVDTLVISGAETGV